VEQIKEARCSPRVVESWREGDALRDGEACRSSSLCKRLRCRIVWSDDGDTLQVREFRAQQCNLTRRYNVERRARRIVRSGHPWRWEGCARGGRRAPIRMLHAAIWCKKLAQLLKWHATGSEQYGWCAWSKCDDTRFHANLCRLAEQQRIDAAVELVQHMIGTGGGEEAEAVRTRRGDRHPCGTDQCASRLMPRDPHANVGESGADEPWDLCERCGNNGERTRPEGVGQGGQAGISECFSCKDAHKIGAIGNMDDERIECWAPLRLEDARSCEWICCVATETVHRLSGEGDEAATSDDCCCTID
jgi:hypothetical protein